MKQEEKTDKICDPIQVTGIVTDRYGNQIEIYDPPFYRKEFEDAYQFIIHEYEIEKKEIAIFIPCALRKPYSQSPSHRLFHSIIDSVLGKDRYHLVIFGTCGVVPAELELMYPFRHYHYMLGKCNDEKVKEDFHRIEVSRLIGYLTKTSHTYEKRIAYCIGPFRRAMIQASTETRIPVVILPSNPLIDTMYDIDCPFPEGSLSMQEYCDEFRDGLFHIDGSG